MLETLGPALTALAVVCIPLTGWFSRRATYEGRLILRIERLGGVYALMPVSAEKSAFEQHVIATIRNLNDWLDPNARRRRRVTMICKIALFPIGVTAAYFINGSFSDEISPWAGPLLGVAIGLLIAFALFLIDSFLDARALSETARGEAQEAEAAAAKRMEAFSEGSPVPVISDDSERRA